ncbi:MAG: helix-turn-helix transcriptional regulator [Clostridia bacterium]|nr:helix-turn-helix transcriptional regulator [Clostridia bacterium]
MFKIKEFRKYRGLSQITLANQIGVTREHLSAIENGHKQPSISLLKKIAKELNTTVKALIVEEEPIEGVV